MFSLEQRTRVRDWMLGVAQTDKRITAGALTGSVTPTIGGQTLIFASVLARVAISA